MGFFKKFFSKNKNLESKVVEKFVDPDDQLITFEMLKTFPENEIISIIKERPEAIRAERLKIVNENSISFRIHMCKGEKWNIHHHDCYESILVYKGKLLEKITNKEINRINSIDFKPYTRHTVEALEESIFYVEFKKPLE